MAEPSPNRAILEAIASNADPRIPLPILLTMAERESTFDPKRRGKAGEYGLFQLLPKTVREELRYLGPLDRLLDPAFNTRLASQYLVILKERFDEWPSAVTHWNGSGPMAREYAAGIFRRLPAWDKFVRDNLEFFKRALSARGAGALGLLAAAAAAFALILLLRSQRREA